MGNDRKRIVLSQGEWRAAPKAVEKYGEEIFERLNSTHPVHEWTASAPGFQDGGRVKEIFTAVKQIGMTDEETE